MKIPIDALARLLGARLEGDPARSVDCLAELEAAGPGALAFYANPRYRAALAATRAGAVLLDESSARLAPAGTARLVVAEPYLAFAKASLLFHPRVTPPAGVHPSAVLEPGARVDPSASVGALAYVGAGASVGARTVLGPGVLVEAGARLGADCLLHAGAIVRERCVLGDRVILQPGAVVGSDGFGFAFDASVPEHRKVPQAGIVRLEDDVEVGANTCIDRATLGETVVGRGAKLDNLVQIAHNVKVGPLSLLVAQSGVSGSSELGVGVILAGQVGVVGHLTIGDGARVGAQSGVARDVPAGETVSGSPAIAHRDWLRASAAFAHLGELVKEVRRLNKRVAELEAKR